MYDKSTGNIVFNSEKLKGFPLRSGIRQECLLLPLLFSTVVEVLAMASEKKKKKVKGIQTGKEEVKLPLLQMA